MKILVTGSRTWENLSKVEMVLYTYLPDIERIIVGDAYGVDKVVVDWCISNEVPYTVYYAEWLKFGKRAGYIRNQDMVDAKPDLCIAFIRDNSRGATMTKQLAEKANIKTIVYTE